MHGAALSRNEWKNRVFQTLVWGGILPVAAPCGRILRRILRRVRRNLRRLSEMLLGDLEIMLAGYPL
jgi:hypothetical protein